MTKKVNVCLIGIGRAGMIHAKNFATRINNASLVAICDPSEEALTAAKEELGIEKTYTDYRDAVLAPNIEAVVIVTPTIFHKAIVLAAAAAGKHILCEKPLAMDEAECDEMIAAAQKSKVKLQVGFMRRFDESFQQAKEIVLSGEIGDVVLVKSLTRGPSHPKPWMFDIRNSSGPIGEVNSHDFDTLRWFTESEVSSIYAVGGNYRSPEVRADYPDYYDTVAMTLAFENGTIGAIDGAQYVQYGYDARVEILGTKGNVMIGEQHKQKIVTATSNGQLIRPAMHSWTYLFEDAYIREDQAFIESILTDTEPLVTGYDGKMAVKLVSLGLKSLLEKRIAYANESLHEEETT